MRPRRSPRLAAQQRGGAAPVRAGLSGPDVRIAGSAACGSFIQGYTTGVLGGALLFLAPHLGLAPRQVGAVATATTLGSVMGTFSAARLSDARGRRPTMAASAALFVVAAVLMCWTPNLEVLVLARFLAGVAIGNCGAVVPVYVAECASAESRGALATLPQLMISSGACVAMVVTLLVAMLRTSGVIASPALAARVSLGATLAPALLYTALVAKLPESPRWLLRAGEREKAAKALRVLRGRDADGELRELEAAAQREDRAASSTAGWRTLLEPKVRRRLGSCVLLQCFQQFTGINAIVYFTPQILKASGTVAALGARLSLSEDSAALAATVVTYVPKIPVMVVTAMLMDAWGRRKLLMAFVPAMGACLAALAYALDSTARLAAPCALAAVALYGVAFNLSLGPVPNIYTAESFPARARSAAMTASLCAQFAAHSVVSFFFPVLVASRGTSTVLYGFAGVCAVCSAFASLFMAETKQASLEELSAELEGE